MGWINSNSILLQLVLKRHLMSTLCYKWRKNEVASVHCIEEHDIYPFSEALNSGMENETNPCNDFHQYSCGKWIERNEVLDTSRIWSVYEMSALSTLIKVKEGNINSLQGKTKILEDELCNPHNCFLSKSMFLFLEILDNPNIDENNEKLSVEKKFYEACMDEGYSSREGYNLVLKIARGIPRDRWQDVLEYYATNFSTFNLFHIKLDVTKHLQIERPRFSNSNERPFKYYGLGNQVKWLHMNGINSFFGDVRPMEDAVIESLHFMEFINQITRNGNNTFEVFSILQLQQFYDYECPSKHAKIEWLQFFQKLAEGTGINFTLHDELSVDIQYLISLCKRLIDTPAHAIVNYLQTNFLSDEETLFHGMSSKRKLSYTERYIHCIQSLPITEGITKEILKSHITQEGQKFVYETFKNIISVLIKVIENSWLVNSVKEALLNRTRGITYGYGTSVDNLKKKLSESATYEFEVGRVAFQNELNSKRAQIINILQIYNRVYKVNREKRHLVCSAFYNKRQNKIVLEAAMLFPTHFYKNAPIAFNYGRLGFTIGHEISHAFNFDIMMHYIDCIPSKDERKKMETLLYRKSHCFVKEFNGLGVNIIELRNYTTDIRHHFCVLEGHENCNNLLSHSSIYSLNNNRYLKPQIDGLHTLEENVADTQGLKLAWKGMNAFIQDREKRGEELPSSEDWNQKKLFFLSFANKWCSKPEYRKDNVVDRHAPHVMRILGTLMNMKEFKETYNCTEGDFMDPITKCDWWDKS